MPETPDTVVFDLGNVLFRWDIKPIVLDECRDDDLMMQYFMKHVWSPEWNLAQDMGRPWAEGVRILSAEHPAFAKVIQALDTRWAECHQPAIEGSVDILQTLVAQETPVYALSNISEKFPELQKKYDFLNLFNGVVTSAELGIGKPHPRIYRTLTERFGLAAEKCVFIDDSRANVVGAQQVGMHGIHFTAPEQLRGELETLKILPARAQRPGTPGR